MQVFSWAQNLRRWFLLRQSHGSSQCQYVKDLSRTCSRNQNLRTGLKFYQAGNLLCGLQQFSAGVFFRCPFYVSDFRRNFRLTGGEIRDPMISGLSKIYIGTVSGTDISIWGCF